MAMTCACHTIAIDMTLSVKIHSARTNPILDSEAGMRRLRTNQAMAGLPVRQAPSAHRIALMARIGHLMSNYSAKTLKQATRTIRTNKAQHFASSSHQTTGCGHNHLFSSAKKFCRNSNFHSGVSLRNLKIFAETKRR